MRTHSLPVSHSGLAVGRLCCWLWAGCVAGCSAGCELAVLLAVLLFVADWLAARLAACTIQGLVAF